MVLFDWSTDRLAERDGFAAWREELLPPLGIGAEPVPLEGGRFRAKLRYRQKGLLSHARVTADPHLIMRRPREIARRLRRGYSVYREQGPGCWFRYAGQEFVTNTGDLVITDADTPWESRTLGPHYRLEALLVPKTLLDPHLPRLRPASAVRLSGRQGAEAIAADYHRSLMREWDRLEPPVFDAMADTFCRLLAIACGAAAGDHGEAIRNARLEQARRLCERHLTDPDLSPSRVAAALGISVRNLHLLFEPTGTSFARYVTRRRLEECRAAMASPLHRRRSVAEIAFAWGFNSVPTFYRAFLREFGMAPGDVRGRAADDAGRD